MWILDEQSVSPNISQSVSFPTAWPLSAAVWDRWGEYCHHPWVHRQTLTTQTPCLYAIRAATSWRSVLHPTILMMRAVKPSGGVELVSFPQTLPTPLFFSQMYVTFFSQPFPPWQVMQFLLTSQLKKRHNRIYWIDGVCLCVIVCVRSSRIYNMWLHFRHKSWLNCYGSSNF